jgi:hypothetical protein
MYHFFGLPLALPGADAGAAATVSEAGVVDVVASEAGFVETASPGESPVGGTLFESLIEPPSVWISFSHSGELTAHHPLA